MSNENTMVVAYPAFGLAGGIVAIIISAALNHSFWWGFLHFWLGWFYVVYALLCRSKEIMPALSAMFGS